MSNVQYAFFVIFVFYHIVSGATVEKKYIQNHSWNIEDIKKKDFVKNLLKESPELLNVMDRDQRSLLLLTAQNNVWQVVDYLLDQNGIDVNAVDFLGMSALCYACQAKTEQYEIVCKLIKNGADVNNNLVPLSEKLKILEDFFKKAQEKMPNNATVEAFLNKIKNLVYENIGMKNSSRFLQEIPHIIKQCNVWLNDNVLRSPLNNDTRSNVEHIISKATESIVDNFSLWSPLHYAVQKKYIKTVKLLVEKQAKIDVQERFYKVTPLFLAANGGDFEIVSYLVDQRASLTLSDDQGRNVLCYAVRGHFNKSSEKIKLEVCLRNITIWEKKDNEEKVALEKSIEEFCSQGWKDNIEITKKNLESRIHLVKEEIQNYSKIIKFFIEKKFLLINMVIVLLFNRHFIGQSAKRKTSFLRFYLIRVLALMCEIVSATKPPCTMLFTKRISKKFTFFCNTVLIHL